MQFIPLAEMIGVLASLIALLFGWWDVKKSVLTKKSIIKHSRGSVALQREALRQISDGKLSDEEISKFVIKLIIELEKADDTNDVKSSMHHMVTRASHSSARNRLLQEIIYEVIDEAETSKMTKATK